MKRWGLFSALFLLCCASALAQATQPNPADPNRPSRSSTPVNVRGQVYAPDGSPLMMIIRLELVSDNPARPPEYIFTDANGRFVLYRLVPDYSYTIVAEADAQNWARSAENFIPYGPRPTVQLHLRPPERDPTAPGARVSVNELKQDVPRPARKEYESALEQIEKGKPERSRQQLERAIELFPDYVAARNELAVALLRENRLPEAEAQLRRALEVDKDAVRPLLNLGLCLYRQQRYTEAITPLERAVQLQPIHFQANLLLGMVLVQSGNDKDAEPILLRAYEQGGKRAARAQFYLSQVYTRRKDYDRAAAALDQYLTDVPDSADAHDLRAALAKLRSASKQ